MTAAACSPAGMALAIAGWALLVLGAFVILGFAAFIRRSLGSGPPWPRRRRRPYHPLEHPPRGDDARAP
jgi:hypothetical protein